MGAGAGRVRAPVSVALAPELAHGGLIVVLGAEADVAVVVEPDSERVPARDADPLSDVELASVHDERSLDVLLAHPLIVVVFLHVAQHLGQLNRK